jgi:DNA polymerase type B, organellar and viral
VLNHLLKLNIETIFVHNLGGFDGVFIYKGLMSVAQSKENVDTIIDQHNKFITISYKYSMEIDKLDKQGNKKEKTCYLKFKDSYRIFPLSLDNLCKVFNVAGKLGVYRPEFNNISILNRPRLLIKLKKYALQDSISLYEALSKAQELYFSDYEVDITSIYSTSTLSMKIFRQKFLKHNIPILKPSEDLFIRKSYLGGATDYYKAYGENLHYYDVNSLYPYVMLKDLPLDLDKKYSNQEQMSNINLKDFFGFALAEVICPDNIINPLLPVSYNGKTIFPKGKWVATYFSEELKEVEKYGYKVKLISGYSYSKVKLFNDYINHSAWADNIKKTSTGSTKFIAKMHLNQLYGYFGRKQDILTTKVIRTNKLPEYFLTHIIKNVIKINSDYLAILISKDINLEVNNILKTVIRSENLSPYYGSAALAGVTLQLQVP